MNHYYDYVEKLKTTHPKVKIVDRSQSTFMKVLAKVCFWNKDFLTNYTTTICNSIYMRPEDIGTEDGYETLRHEVKHVEQWEKWNVLYYLSYFFLLPSVLTMRAYWEYQGYVENMRVEFEATGDVSDGTLNWIVREFVYQNYLWMFPFPKTLRGMLERKRDEIIAGR